MTQRDFIEGWTETIVDSLKTDNATQDLTGMQVVLVLYDKDANLIPYGGQSGVEEALTGKVFFTPAVGDLLASKSPYGARWKVTDVAGEVAFWPTGPEPIEWNVYKP